MVITLVHLLISLFVLLLSFGTIWFLFFPPAILYLVNNKPVEGWHIRKINQLLVIAKTKPEGAACDAIHNKIGNLCYSRTIYVYRASKATALLVMMMVFLSGCSSGAVDPPDIPDVWMLPDGTEAISPYSCEEIREIFAYDTLSPLDLQVLKSDRVEGATLIDITYASPMGGQVPATLVLPDGPGLFPGLLYQHGMPGNRQSLIPAAVTYARMGAVVLLIDAPFSRRENGLYEPLTFTEQDRHEQIQMIVDLRRGMDLLLTRPEIDPQRLAYIGISYGGAMGGLLAGVEDRIKGYALQVGDGGLVTHLTGPEDSGSWLEKPEEVRQQWLTWMWPIEPVHYVGCAAPTALLFQNGTLDRLVPPADALRYQRAGSEPKTVLWYKSGHALGSSAGRDQAKWLSEIIGISSRRPIPQSAEALLTAWAVVTAGALCFMVWEQWKHRPTLSGNRIMWLLTSLFMGPLAVASHKISNHQLRTPEGAIKQQSSARQALSLAEWAAARNSLGGIGVLALIFYFPQVLGNNLSLQIAVTFLLPFFTSWFTFNLSRWISASNGKDICILRYPVFIEMISTCLVLSGLYPTVNILIGRWLTPWSAPFSFDLTYPPLWGALSLGAMAGAMTAYPFYLWMLQRGLIDWKTAALPEAKPARKFAWHVQVGLVTLSFAVMLCAIFLSTLIAEG